MIIILLILIGILIILWWLTLRSGTITPSPVVSITPTVLPTTVFPTLTPLPSPSSTTILPTPTSPPGTVTPTPSTFVPQPTIAPTGSTISPTAVPFASPPSLVVPPIATQATTTSPTTPPTPEVIPPVITVTATGVPTPSPAKTAELVINPGTLPGELKYQYRFTGETQKFSFADDNLIVAFPTSIPNRFRLVGAAFEDNFEIIKIYDKTVPTGGSADVWLSPVFYSYVGLYNNKIYLFGGSNDSSPQDIISHNIETGEGKLLANDVGNVTQIAGNRITYEVFVEIPFDDENPDQEIPVGEEKTLTLD